MPQVDLWRIEEEGWLHVDSVHADIKNQTQNLQAVGQTESSEYIILAIKSTPINAHTNINTHKRTLHPQNLTS